MEKFFIFRYEDPQVSTIAVQNLEESTIAVLLIGYSLGPISEQRVLLNGNPCTISQSTHSAIEFLTNETKGLVSFSSFGVRVPDIIFDYESLVIKPAVIDIRPSSGPTTGGYNLTISGSHFHDELGGSMQLRARVGDAGCYPILFSTKEIIHCVAPPGQGVGLPIMVIRREQFVSSGGVRFSYDGPIITYVTPSHGSTAGGEILSIFGDNFGVFSPSIWIGDRTCETIEWNHTYAACRTPHGVGKDRNIRVQVASQSAEALLFSYFAPIVSSLNPTVGPTQGGFEITIVGSNFGKETRVLNAVKDGTLNGLTGYDLSIGGKECRAVSWSDTEIVCIVPMGVGKQLSVSVMVDFQRWTSSLSIAQNSSLYFDYLPPYIEKITPPRGPTIGRTVIVAEGNSFGAQGALQIDSGRQWKILAGKHTHTRIEFESDPGTGRNHSLVLIVANQRSNAVEWSYDPPLIISMDPLEADAKGQLLTLIGRCLFIYII